MARPRHSRAAVEARPRVPDRSLTPDGPLPTIAIRAAGTHQFVYRKMVEGPLGAAAPNHGDLVRVVDRDGLHLGFALWNGRSQISLRFLSRHASPRGRNSGAGASTRPRRCGRACSTSIGTRTPTASSMPRGMGSQA